MEDSNSQAFVEKMLKEIDDRRDVLKALREINRVLDLSVSDMTDVGKIQYLKDFLKKVGLR